MKIFTTWTDELNAFRRMFDGHEVNLLPDNRKGLKIDLLIFPGGDDVHPERYGSKLPDDSLYKGWVNPGRDEHEFSILDDVFSGTLKVTRILGICRGMQLLNVGMSGSLVYDIYTRYGRTHPNHHAVEWTYSTMFSSIAEVNSMHHQCIYSAGDKYRPVVLATEPRTRITEAIMWGSSYLGFQFHPELWGNLDEMKVFSEGIESWVDGKPILSESDSRRPERKRRIVNEYVSTSLEETEQVLHAFYTTNPWEATPPSPAPSEMPDEDEEEEDIELESDEDNEEQEDW